MAVDLIYYASNGKQSKVLDLLRDGVYVDAENHNNETALFFAAKNGRTSTLRSLLKYGSDPNKLNSHGFTPVMIAAINCHEKCLRILLIHGGTYTPISEDERKQIVEDKKNLTNTSITPIVKIHDRSLLTSICIDDVTIGHKVGYVNIENLFEMVNCKVSGQRYTCKVTSTEKAFEQTQKELELLRSLRHPYIVNAYYTTGSADRLRHILITEPINGTLYQLLHYSEEKLLISDGKRILKELAYACLFLHNLGYVHNFVNSSSVFFTSKRRVKLGNFLYCQQMDSDKGPMINIEGRKFHIPYTAPEVMVKNILSIKSDVYSFGCLAWEIFGRKNPWSWLTTEDLIAMSTVEHNITLPVQPCWPEFIKSIVPSCTKYKNNERPEFNKILTMLRGMNDVASVQSCYRQTKQILPLACYAPSSKFLVVENQSGGKKSVYPSDHCFSSTGLNVTFSNVETTMLYTDYPRIDSTRTLNNPVHSMLRTEAMKSCLKVTCDSLQQNQQTVSWNNLNQTKKQKEQPYMEIKTSSTTPWNNRKTSSLKELEILLCLMRERGETEECIGQVIHDYFIKRAEVTDNITTTSTTSTNQQDDKQKLDDTKQQQIINELFEKYDQKLESRKWAKKVVKNGRDILGNRISMLDGHREEFHFALNAR